MGLRHFTISEELIHTLATQTADFTSDFTRKSPSARTIEIFANISNVGGATPSLDLILETSLEETANFVEQTRISAITANGSFSTVINRADHALGRFFRVRGVITGGGGETFDVELKMARME